MNPSGIGKLERVPLREVWEHEAYDFTQWLQENIEVLNEALDLSLVNVDREQAAGSFSIDLVAEDEGGGTVIIENQVEKSNHDHLGKVDYLPKRHGGNQGCDLDRRRSAARTRRCNRLVERVEQRRFLHGQSGGRSNRRLTSLAPLFTLIVGPSEETKEVGQTKKEIAERYIIRKHWWTQLIERSAKINKLHAHLTPGEYAWIGTSSGVRGLNLNYVVTMDQCAAELYIDRGKDSERENENIFDQLLAHKTEVESAFGGPLSWERLDGRKACRIRYTQPGGGYRSPEAEWPKIQDGIIHAMDRLEKALRPYLKQLKLGAEVPIAGQAT